MEGLCTSNQFGFEFSVLHLHLLLFFFECSKKTWKKQFVKISSRRSSFMYTCVLCTHIRIHICWDSIHLDSSSSPGVSSRSLGSHQSTPYAVCVCVHNTPNTHTHTHIHSNPPSQIEKMQTTPRSRLLSKIALHASNNCSAYTSWNPRHSSSNANQQSAHTPAHLYTLRRVYSQTFTLMLTDMCRSVHSCTCTGAQDTCLVHAIPTITNAHTPSNTRQCRRCSNFFAMKLLKTIQNLENFDSDPFDDKTKNIELNHNDVLAEPNIQRRYSGFTP